MRLEKLIRCLTPSSYAPVMRLRRHLSLARLSKGGLQPEVQRLFWFKGLKGRRLNFILLIAALNEQLKLHRRYAYARVQIFTRPFYSVNRLHSLHFAISRLSFTLKIISREQRLLRNIVVVRMRDSIRISEKTPSNCRIFAEKIAGGGISELSGIKSLYQTHECGLKYYTDRFLPRSFLPCTFANLM